MKRTRRQKRFKMSKVAADWHELMIPQRTMQPSIARLSEQLDTRWFAASRHATAPISHTRASISQTLCASALFCSNVWMSNHPHRHVNAIALRIFCSYNCETSRICH